MTLTAARRVATLDDIERAGDYSGPHPIEYGKGDTRQAVWFLLPVHQGSDKLDHSAPGDGIHLVTSPPWTFRECGDGSLEVRASIGCGPQPYYWHGYLDEGNIWRQV